MYDEAAQVFMEQPLGYVALGKSSKGDKLSLSKRKYALDILQETGLLGFKPAIDNLRWRPVPHSGTLNVLSKFIQEPPQVHWVGALRVLAYIKSALGRGLLYQRHHHLRSEAYLDASYAIGPGDRKSTTDYCTYVGGNLVTWRSRKQKVVASSSAEFEYRTMASTMREMLWLQFLLQELDIEAPTPMLMNCDNKLISSSLK
ncbi:secreted RxLR effector protein 161-like [Wolffia australiana]